MKGFLIIKYVKSTYFRAFKHLVGALTAPQVPNGKVKLVFVIVVAWLLLQYSPDTPLGNESLLHG